MNIGAFAFFFKNDINSSTLHVRQKFQPINGICKTIQIFRYYSCEFIVVSFIFTTRRGVLVFLGFFNGSTICSGGVLAKVGKIAA